MLPFNTRVLCSVNTGVVLLPNTKVLNCEAMTLGERLKAAREYAGLTQEELGVKACCGQGVVSKIERGDQDKTAYVVKLATACGVRPEWLDDESGEMVDGLYVESEKIKRAVVLMQEMPEYLVDEAIASIDQVKKLARIAEEHGSKKA